MADYVDKLKKMQVQVQSVSELRQKLQEAKTLKQINEIRFACVEFMKKDKSILKEWQKKFWSLKNCPTCGHTKPGLI